ncbi:hypothetical protein ACMFMG_003380 [Clarireedia jacksonii]
MALLDKSTIDNLKKELSTPAKVVVKGDENYRDSIKRWSAAAEKEAGIIVYPTTPEDVSKAILFSKSHGLELATVGGGHGSSGASSTNGGLCIDLSKMRSVTIDLVNKTAICEGGCLWADVDKAAAPHHLAAVGGTVNHTGIGGLTLGGGYGHLTPKHGLVIDNLLAAEMVLADGSIVVCTKDKNPDLFWAIRGAGISFGVATKFTYRLHEQPNRVWGGMLVFPREKLGPIVEFANTVVDPKVENALLLLGFGAPPPHFAPAVMLPMFYNGTEAEAKAFYTPLFELGPLADMTAEMDYVQINGILNEAMRHGLRRSMKGAVFMAPLNLAYAEEIFTDFEAFMKEVPGAKHTMVVFEFIPYGKVLKVGQQETAFANRGAYGNLMFGPGWESKEDDDRCRQWTRRMAAKAKKELERRMEDGTDEVTKDGVGSYSNYDGAEHQAGKLVYGVNYDRLVELKKQYDPENVFSKGPKLVS